MKGFLCAKAVNVALGTSLQLRCEGKEVQYRDRVASSVRI